MSFKTQVHGNKNWQGKHRENSTSSFLHTYLVLSPTKIQKPHNCLSGRDLWQSKVFKKQFNRTYKYQSIIPLDIDIRHSRNSSQFYEREDVSMPYSRCQRKKVLMRDYCLSDSASNSPDQREREHKKRCYYQLY